MTSCDRLLLSSLRGCPRETKRGRGAAGGIGSSLISTHLAHKLDGVVWGVSGERVALWPPHPARPTQPNEGRNRLPTLPLIWNPHIVGCGWQYLVGGGLLGSIGGNLSGGVGGGVYRLHCHINYSQTGNVHPPH